MIGWERLRPPLPLSKKNRIMRVICVKPFSPHLIAPNLFQDCEVREALSIDGELKISLYGYPICSYFKASHFIPERTILDRIQKELNGINVL